ncbi:MAG: Nif3-like dinuclear metal center hexameric protein [Oscillospiraceae bacterium]|nr:Nif3-like dinuclear metal center hexameric protein [Oscillospiraceae bacterium]
MKTKKIIKIKDIYNFLDSVAPFKYSCDWDNSGFLTGNINEEFKSGLICLDITDEIIDEAIKKNCNLIISHHPVIFDKLNKITKDMIVYKLIKNNINTISLHTNLDLSKTGVNFVLAQTLNLLNINNIGALDKSSEKNIVLLKDKVFESFVLVGNLEKSRSPVDFAKFVKDKLFCKKLSFISGSKKIKTVAICAGSGSSFFDNIKNKNIDAYVTSEIKYNIWLEAKRVGLTLIDAGHFNTENLICKHLTNILNKHFDLDKFETAEKNIDIIEVI